MLKLSCTCGKVRIETAARPAFIHECNCQLCTRAEARWAHFHPSEVKVEGATEGYCRDDKAEPSAEVHSCPECGLATHFVLTPGAIAKHGNTLMGVNMRLADASDLSGIELRFPDGRAWPGEGEFSYVREAIILGS